MQIEKRLDIQVGNRPTPRCPNQQQMDTFNEGGYSIELRESLSAELSEPLSLRSHLRITIRNRHTDERPPYKNADGDTLH